MPDLILVVTVAIGAELLMCGAVWALFHDGPHDQQCERRYRCGCAGRRTVSNTLEVGE